ncbi:hypothetical protein [Spiroplasma taiwanense]|uniref:Uncharacterized protein n=1 Tax=Spiroplasma taiwanense CT-1 TaxID=1276220 RepID=S5MHM3_9MOLU|nr:hypothetical protein [Spiroplasma taiwanense]AGR41360.1 hypothetical protein STAIW_v1c07560 [Spiroplasma taiwanense CT-1]
MLKDNIKESLYYSSWNGRPRSFNDIVEDGIYTIYSVNSQFSTNGKIYFYDYQRALNSVIEGISHSTLYSSQEAIIYMYINIDDNGNLKLYFYKNDDELREVVKEILS